MKTRVAAVAALFLLACGGFLALRLLPPAAVASAAAASDEAYQYRFLEVGKTYTFHWRDTTKLGTLAEVPRAGWVKINAPATGADGPAAWVNLATVEWISEDAKGK